MKNAINNKGNVGAVVGIFITVLLVAVIVGITFLFSTSIKSTASNVDNQRTKYSVVNETLRVNYTGVYYSVANYPYVICDTPSYIANATGGAIVGSGNYTISNCFIQTSTGGNSDKAFNNTLWTINYTYSVPTGNAYTAINSTENAGYGLISYLPILFLALIFGVILVIIIKVVMPYMSGSKEF